MISRIELFLYYNKMVYNNFFLSNSFYPLHICIGERRMFTPNNNILFEGKSIFNSKVFFVEFNNKKFIYNIIK